MVTIFAFAVVVDVVVVAMAVVPVVLMIAVLSGACDGGSSCHILLHLI